MCRPVPLSSTVDVQCQWTQCPGSGDSWPVANERRYYKPHVTDSVVREPLKRKFQVSRNFEAVENSDGAASALAADSTCAAQGQKTGVWHSELICAHHVAGLLPLLGRGCERLGRQNRSRDARHRRPSRRLDGEVLEHGADGCGRAVEAQELEESVKHLSVCGSAH